MRFFDLSLAHRHSNNLLPFSNENQPIHPRYALFA